MSNFKTGDKLRVINNSGKLSSYKIGEVGIAKIECNIVTLGNKPLGMHSSMFELVLDFPNPPRKHAEMIKAWADGANIMSRLRSSEPWATPENPKWYDNYEYRIASSELEIEIERIESELRKLADDLKVLKNK